MSAKTEIPIADQPAPSGGALQDYALQVAANLRDAMQWGYDKNTRPVGLEDLCGAIQLIYAGLPNLRDAERLDQLARIGAEWRVTVRGQVVGTGSVRSAIDQAISRLLPPI